MSQTTRGPADATHITFEKASELLDKSVHAVRQLVFRGQLKVHRIGYKTFLDLNSVLTYYARKKGLPSWEENIKKVSKRSFVAIDRASASLMVQNNYVVRLLLEKKLEGYVTAYGDVMISVESINAYLRQPDVDTKEL